MKYATASLITFVIIIIITLIIVIIIISINDNNVITTPTTNTRFSSESSCSSDSSSISTTSFGRNLTFARDNSSITRTSISPSNFSQMSNSLESSLPSYYTMLPVSSSRLRSLGYIPLDREFLNVHIANEEGQFLALLETGIQLESEPTMQYHYKPEENVLMYGIGIDRTPVRLRDIGTVSVYWNSMTKLILIVNIKGETILALHTSDRKLSPLHVLVKRS